MTLFICKKCDKGFSDQDEQELIDALFIKNINKCAKCAEKGIIRYKIITLSIMTLIILGVIIIGINL